jgi:hypothetical protein
MSFFAAAACYFHRSTSSAASAAAAPCYFHRSTASSSAAAAAAPCYFHRSTASAASAAAAPCYFHRSTASSAAAYYFHHSLLLPRCNCTFIVIARDVILRGALLFPQLAIGRSTVRRLFGELELFRLNTTRLTAVKLSLTSVASVSRSTFAITALLAMDVSNAVMADGSGSPVTSVVEYVVRLIALRASNNLTARGESPAVLC